MEELIGAAALVGRYVLAFVFLATAVPKLLARTEFEQAIANYAVLPRAFVPPLAAWLPRVELVLAVALMLGVAITASAAVVGALLVAFSSGVSLNLLRGREISCGCSGNVAPRKISWGLVAGDLALAGVALLIALRDPGVLALYAGGEARPSELSADDGLAALVVAAMLVLVYLLVTGWIRVGAAARALRGHTGQMA